MVAQAIEILFAILLFCLKLFYWGSVIGCFMAYTGCVAGTYYVMRERHEDYHRVKLDSIFRSVIGAGAISLLIAFVPLINTAMIYVTCTDHHNIIKSAVDKIEVRHGWHNN